MKISPKRRSKYNNVQLGVILGLLLPAVTFLLVWIYRTSAGIPIENYINSHKEADILTKLVSLCVIPNLLLFYAFLRKNRYRSVRGVIISVFLIILWVVYIKLQS
ncbi:MAG: hypothetical protein U9N85_08445 [Bacteroidota bacterium]|nr:hypothetical protein [Bacteroidota bacterium]